MSGSRYPLVFCSAFAAISNRPEAAVKPQHQHRQLESCNQSPNRSRPLPKKSCKCGVYGNLQKRRRPALNKGYRQETLEKMRKYLTLKQSPRANK